MESNSPNKAFIGVVVVVLIAVAAAAAIALSNSTQQKSANESASVSPSVSVSPSSSALAETSQSSDFKDGTYTADGSYQTPGGRESIGVTVTLTNGVVTSASVEQKGERGESKEYQAKFASGFASQVVGKKIDEVSLSRVAGSSLTSNGFNNAIATIENQAKA